MKKCNVKHYLLSSLLTITTLLNISPVHGMEKESVYTLKKLTQRAKEDAERFKEAKEYNKNHTFINRDILLNIFSNYEQEKGGGNLSNWAAYNKIKIFSSIHMTCQFFNALMPFKKIIDFCKTLKKETKNEVLSVALSRIHQSSCGDDDLIFSALLQAGADATVQEKGIPLFFYAKSIRTAQAFIKRGCDIHTKICKQSERFESLEQGDILSHIVNKEYPAELIEFYLQEGVIPQQRILHKLVYELKNYCTSERLMNEFLKKSELLLAIIPDTTKDDLSWEHITPLDKLRELLTSTNIKEEYLSEFKEKIIDLFIGYGCQTTCAIGNYYMRNIPCFDINNNFDDSFMHEYDTFDDGGIIEYDNATQFIDTEVVSFDKEVVKKCDAPKEVVKKYDSLMEFVKNNSIEEILTLINHGHVNINEQDKVGNTLLMWALMNNNDKMTRLLLKHGANPNISNSIERTPLEIALENEDNEMADLLINASETNETNQG